jgi:hypothetical protein
VFANLIDFFLFSFVVFLLFDSLNSNASRLSSIDAEGFETEKGVSRLPARSVRPHSRRLRLLAAIRSFLNSSKLFKYCLHTQRQQYSSHAFLLFGLLASESREQHTGSTQSFESANI